MIKEGAKREQFNCFKKQALMILTTALRGPLMLMMGCGYANDAGGELREVHDHNNKKMLDLVTVDVLYDGTIHGPLEDFIREGERVPGVPDSPDGGAPIHRHNTKPGFGGTSGPYEYVYEKQ